MRRGGRVAFLLFTRLVSRKTFDFELFGNVEKRVELLLLHIHLAVVHEVEDQLEVAELDTWREQCQLRVFQVLTRCNRKVHNAHCTPFK